MNSSSSSFHLFVFAATVIFLRCLYPTGAVLCHPDEEAALLAFKAGITQDPSGILSSWKKGTDCCFWRFVNCNDDDNHVTLLSINGKSTNGESVLSGTISPSLAKLQHLQVFSLLNLKNITGSFPQFVFEMPKLRFFGIVNNRLSGPLPTNISTQSQLLIFSVKGNLFTGTIPLEFANLKEMFILDFSGNHLSGTIPDIFKPMTKLRYLYLSRNNFSGEFPQSITSIPPSTPLTQLDLSWNQFSGTVPKILTKLTSLVIIGLSHNLLTDPLPVLKGINSLDLSYNRFHLKTIPKWITSSRTIYVLNLAKCGIKMRLDDWKPKQTALYEYLDLSENQISGSPARFLNEKTQLREFRASGNKLRFDMGKLNFSTKQLETLDLSRNLIFGKVPSTVAGLQTLNLSQNHLCGKLPVTKFPASAFAGNDCLCGSPLAPCKL